MNNLVIPLCLTIVSLPILATEPCGDFGECKVLIEINASDGDIGFHFLMDGDELNSARLYDPRGAKVFQEQAKGPLAEQKLTETFVESAEPLCWADPEADEDDEIVTLEDFLARWPAGTYIVSGQSDGGENLVGETLLSYNLPAAPIDLAFDGSTIYWNTGDDLGRCASKAMLDSLVANGVINTHPENVAVSLWEVVFEPDTEDGDPVGAQKFSIRVAGDLSPLQVTVPAEYINSLPADTPAKIEVGAIGHDDNATFTEIGDLCVNEIEGCD